MYLQIWSNKLVWEKLKNPCTYLARELKKVKQYVFKFGTINLFEKNSKIRVNKTGVNKVMKKSQKTRSYPFFFSNLILDFCYEIKNICKIKPKVAFSSVKFPLHHTADSCLKGNFVEGHINWGANMWIKLEFIFVHIIFDSQGLPYRFIFFSI